MIPVSPRNAEKFKRMGEDIADTTLDKISMGITGQLNIDANPGDFLAANAAIDHVLQACIDKLLAEQQIMRSTKGYIQTVKVITELEEKYNAETGQERASSQEG